MARVLCVLAGGAIAGGCSDKVTVRNVVPSAENRPPLIIRQGPALPGGAVDVGTAGKELYVVVGDPDGLDDIAGIFLNIASENVHRVIARPGVSTGFCEGPSYAPNDTLEIMSLIATTHPGVSDCVLTRAGGYCAIQSLVTTVGTYSSPPPCSAFPDLSRDSPHFGATVALPCQPLAAFSAFGVYPPAAASPRNLFITYADIEYRGITVTVYDASGASATAAFPDLRFVYSTDEERQAAP